MGLQRFSLSVKGFRIRVTGERISENSPNTLVNHLRGRGSIAQIRHFGIGKWAKASKTRMTWNGKKTGGTTQTLGKIFCLDQPDRSATA